MKKTLQLSATLTFAFIILGLFGCGGGGSNSGGGNPGGGNTGGGSQLPSMVITTPSALPGTLQNHPYSVKLEVSNSQGAVKWSIAPVSPTALFVEGLAIDEATGVLSGVPTFLGGAGFIATVKDATGRVATKGFNMLANTPLVVTPSQSVDVAAYRDVYGLRVDYQGGVYPYHISVTGGSLPPGFRLDSTQATISGSAYVDGTYTATVTISDSFSPAEVGTQEYTIRVLPPPLQVRGVPQSRLPLNRPFSGLIAATGGIGPYLLSTTGGSLPPGMTINSNGIVSGTPQAAGSYYVDVTATDASSPSQRATSTFLFTVYAPLSRNDTPANATPVLDDGLYEASLSPYEDPPNQAPLQGDQDYYKVISVSESVVHLATHAREWGGLSPIDTVIEVTDGNGVRMNSCRLPGDTSENFNSPCLNDDVSNSPHNQDSALDIKTPGAPSTPGIFYIRVFDWSGNARPDFHYWLGITGLIKPLAIQTNPPAPAARGKLYSQQLLAYNANGNTSWTITAGSLPQGLMIDPSGLISGTATTSGTSSFTVQAKDGSAPPQVAAAQFSIQVVDPIHITSSSNWPDACLNKPYSFVLTTSGGIAPIYWSFFSMNWIPINLDQSTGIFSGTPGLLGTFTGTLGVSDATNNGEPQTITLNVVNCP